MSIFLRKDSISKLLNINEFYLKFYSLIRNKTIKDYSFIALDIDNFSGYNALYGVERGNEILAHVGKQIKEFLRPKEYAMRVTADNFGLLAKKDKELELRLQNLILAIREEYKNIKKPLSASVGIHNLDDKVINFVECDMYAQLAKQNIKNSLDYHIGYYDILDDVFFREQTLLNDFELSLKQKEFILFYQAKIDMKTNKIIGAEALIRWNHQEYGLLNPSQFLNIFEKKQCMTKLDVYVVEEACIDLLKILNSNEKLKNFRIAINLSGEGFLNDETMKEIENIIFRYNINPRYIEFELTESFFINESKVPLVINRINYLRETGFHIAMDDFGSGYSSLNLLKNLNVDTLKLDKCFLDNEGSKKAHTIITSVIALAKKLGIKTVAEGVETEEQQEELKKLGCTIGQGYLYSKPIPLNVFLKDFMDIYN